jgi:hypothetical protein
MVSIISWTSGDLRGVQTKFVTSRTVCMHESTDGLLSSAVSNLPLVYTFLFSGGVMIKTSALSCRTGKCHRLTDCCFKAEYISTAENESLDCASLDACCIETCLN